MADFKVFVVDDDQTVSEIIHAILEPDYEVESFLSAEECLARLEQDRPDLFLLDVNLPGMNGYELCTQLKQNLGFKGTPVIFVSGYDTIEERIQGYDAGGEDFIVKPFEPEELMRKVLVAKNFVESQRSLAEQAEQAELLSSLVMASMDETGILLQFMSKLIAMESVSEIANGVLELLQRYRLEGVVQTRLGDTVQTVSAAGVNLPLESSVIEHVRNQGRIFEFKTRGVHNFDRVTIMVNNLPLHDPDYCGRLRDHLSVAAQGVDSRLKAIQAELAVHSALDNVGNTIMELRDIQRRNTEASSRMIADLQETLLNSFYKLGLTDNQEKFLQNLVGDFMERMARLLNSDSETQNMLFRLNERLGQLRSS